MKKILVFIITSFLLMVNVIAQQATSSPNVVYDNFNITEPNHAKISISLKTLDPSNMTVTGNDAAKINFSDFNNWYDGGFAEGVSVRGKGLYYTGPITFGSGTSTAKNSIDAVVALRWNNAAALYDGTKADVLMTISDIEFNVRALGNSSLNANGTFNVLIALSEDEEALWFYSINPQTRVLKGDEVFENLTTDQKNALTSKSYSGNSYKVNIKILKHGTNTPIDSKYQNLAFGMKDFDVTDKTINSSDIIEQGAGQYNEGIELIEGFDSLVHFATATPLDGHNITEQSIVKATTGPHGGVKVTVDPVKKADDLIRPEHNDDNTYYSGMMTMASPQSLTFYWTGVSCGSQLFSAQDIVVKQKHNEDGLVSTSSYGKDIYFTKVNTWEATEHPMNSTPTYTYDPDDGYHVVSVKVDGNVVEVSPDYEYTFEKLSYNLLERLNPDGSVMKDESGHVVYEGEPHTIEITYAKNNFIIVYEDGGGKDGVEKMPDEEATYGQEISLSKNEYDKEHYDFVNWEAYIEDAEGNREPYLDDNGNQIYFEDKEDVGHVPVPDGGKLVVVAQWKVKDSIAPKTGLLSIFTLLVVSVMGYVIYTYATKGKLVRS